MYEIFEHTADFGIRVRADNVNDLFADAARGLFSLMVANLGILQPVEEVAIEINGGDPEELFHDWLAELLYQFNVHRMVLGEFMVDVAKEKVSATARGEKLDLQRHLLEVEVKAITWHALKIEKTDEGWIGEVIVDV